jgi:hypothetical protein
MGTARMQENARAKRQSRLAQALKLYRDILAKHPGAVLPCAVTHSIPRFLATPGQELLLSFLQGWCTSSCGHVSDVITPRSC